MGYRIVFKKGCLKDLKKIKQAGLNKKVDLLLDIIKENPFRNPPPYEKLLGNLKGKYSRRISYQHRLVYSVDETLGKIVVYQFWTHYDNI